MIRRPPPTAPTTIPSLRQCERSIAGISTPAVGSVASVVVMTVSAMTRCGVAGWLRHGRRVPGEKAPACELLRRFAAAWTGLDAHCMVRIHDALDLHAAAGPAHFRLNAPAMPPRRKLEHRDLAPSLNRAPTLVFTLHSMPLVVPFPRTAGRDPEGATRRAAPARSRRTCSTPAQSAPQAQVNIIRKRFRHRGEPESL